MTPALYFSRGESAVSINNGLGYYLGCQADNGAFLSTAGTEANCTLQFFPCYTPEYGPTQPAEALYYVVGIYGPQWNADDIGGLEGICNANYGATSGWTGVSSDASSIPTDNTAPTNGYFLLVDVGSSSAVDYYGSSYEETAGAVCHPPAPSFYESTCGQPNFPVGCSMPILEANCTNQNNYQYITCTNIVLYNCDSSGSGCSFNAGDCFVNNGAQFSITDVPSPAGPGFPNAAMAFLNSPGGQFVIQAALNNDWIDPGSDSLSSESSIVGITGTGVIGAIHIIGEIIAD